MCSVRAGSWRWFVGLVTLLMGSAPLGAQGPAATLTRMESRLDSLNKVAADRNNALARERISDTVVVGGLRVATSPPYRGLVAVAAEEAWNGLHEQFGPALMRIEIPVVQFGATGTPAAGPTAAMELARMFERTSARTIWQHQDPVLFAWLRGSIPGDTVSGRALAAIAEQLAGRPALPNTFCLQGDASNCAVALGVGIGADTLGEWYPPSTWPRLAGLIEGELSGTELIARQDCMNRHAAAACRAVLTPPRLLLPVGAEGRLYLVQLALEAGGASAFERLSRDHSLPLDSRLVAAAGVPIDTLLARWLAAVQGAAPQGPAGVYAELFLALAWSAGILSLALWGSR